MTAFAFPKATLDPHVHDLPTRWVRTQDELDRLTDEIDGTDVVALDTEFIKRTTYYPILALIQVNTGKAIYLIDAPRLDLSEFWQALAEVPVMVWYACGEDLGIFYLLCDVPPLTNVFDVQIGVAYLTGKLQVGYSQAVAEILGVQLDKGESQSDWLARPLTADQENYAADDVRYLLALYHAVKDSLTQKGTLAYAQEDCGLYTRELHATQHMPDDELYLEFVAPNYTQRQLAVLKALVEWRETLAKATNEPRSFIIGKQALREIVMDTPQTIKELARTTLNRHALRLYGSEIIKLIKTAKSLPQDKLPPLPPPTYTSKEKLFKKPMDKAVAQYSLELGVPENLLLRGRWINQLLYMIYQELPTDALPDGLKGYRHEWTVQVLLPLLKSYQTAIHQGFECSIAMTTKK